MMDHPQSYDNELSIDDTPMIMNQLKMSNGLLSSYNQINLLSNSSHLQQQPQIPNQHNQHNQSNPNQVIQQSTLALSYESLFNNLYNDPNKSIGNAEILLKNEYYSNQINNSNNSNNNNNNTLINQPQITNNNISNGNNHHNTTNNHHHHHGHNIPNHISSQIHPNGNNSNTYIIVTPSSDISSPSPHSNNSSSSPLHSPMSPNEQQHIINYQTPNHSNLFQSNISNQTTIGQHQGTNYDHIFQQVQHQQQIQHLNQLNQQQSNIPIVQTPSTVGKKLKRGFGQMVQRDEWDSYLPPYKTNKLFNSSKHDLTGSFNFRVKRIDKNIQFSELDSAWILYRQNRFQVDCDLSGSLESWSNNNGDRSNGLLFINYENKFVEISGLYFTLYVLKFTNSQSTISPNDQNERVSIHQLGSSSGKKDGRLPVDPCPVVKGKANWTKLQFGSATANNARLNPDQPNPNQQFFRIVVTLNAVIDSNPNSNTTNNGSFTSTPLGPNAKYIPIQCKISPPMIVRGQNPGRFLNQDKSSKKDTNSSPRSEINNSNLSNNTTTSSNNSNGSQLFLELPVNNNSLKKKNSNELKTSTSSTSSSSDQSDSDVSVHSHSTLIKNVNNNNNTNGLNVNNNEPLNNNNWIDNNNDSPNNNNNNNTNNNIIANYFTTSTNLPTFDSNIDNSNFFQTLKQPPSLFANIDGLNHPPLTVQQPMDTDQQQQQQINNNNLAQQQQQNNSKSNLWIKNPFSNGEDIIYMNGKVGINTTTPTQALTVNGNVLVTGELFKPSDKRIKRNIAPDQSNHWENIDKLKIYEYDRIKMQGYDQNSGDGKENYVKEKGFLAQEVKQILPNAVKVIGDVKLQDGSTVPNLMVVNDRVLLMENIGATQQIGRTLKTEQDHIVEMDKEINRVKIEGKRDQHVVLSKMQDLVSFMLSEDSSHHVNKPREEDESCVYCSLMGLGPAWTCFVFGFFVPIFWIAGSMFLFSGSRVKWVCGLANFLALIVLTVMVSLFTFYLPSLAVSVLVPSFVGLGILVCIFVGFFRQKNVESRKRYLRERVKLLQNDGYRNLNDHVETMRNDYRRNKQAQEDYIHGNNSTGGVGTRDRYRETVPVIPYPYHKENVKSEPIELREFYKISKNNNQILQETPLQEIILNYGKKNPINNGGNTVPALKTSFKSLNIPATNTSNANTSNTTTPSSPPTSVAANSIVPSNTNTANTANTATTTPTSVSSTTQTTTTSSSTTSSPVQDSVVCKVDLKNSASKLPNTSTKTTLFTTTTTTQTTTTF